MARAEEPPAPPAPTPPAAIPAPSESALARAVGEVHVGAGIGVQLRLPHVAGKLVPGSLTWRGDRYELFAGYFQDSVVSGYRLNGYPAHVGWAPIHKVVAVSRRFNLVDRPRLRGFVGIGAAYKATTLCSSIDAANDRSVTLDYTEPVYHGCDKLNGSHLNYLSQAGLRYYNADRSQGIELAFRHLSNAGLASPNLGENFVTLELLW